MSNKLKNKINSNIEGKSNMYNGILCFNFIL